MSSIKKYDNKDLWGWYIAPQVFWRQNNYYASVRYNEWQNDTTILNLNDRLKVNKICYGMNLLLGYQIDIFPKFYADFYMGFGIIYRKIYNSEREFYATNVNQSYDELEWVIVDPYNKHLSEYSGSRTNFLFGCRIGIRL